MNIFIIHSGTNRDEADITKQIIENRCPNQANVLILENGGRLWKFEALKLIKMSQMVLFLVGETSHLSPNISWELKKAIKYNKYLVVHKLNPSYKLNDVLFKTDPFSSRSYINASEADIDTICKKISSYETGTYNVFNTTIEEQNKEELLEQYKVFLQTSEDLVVRRQNVNNFYITINAALFTIFSVCISISDSYFSKLLIALLLLAIGIILDVSWLKTLEAYGILNSSKMKVISIIEKQLPASLYDSEWIVMSDKLNSKKYVSFTDNEKKIPKLFIVLYIILTIFLLVSFIFSNIPITFLQ